MLLPDDAALAPVAEQAAAAARGDGQDVLVVPSTSVLQGLAALAVHDPRRRPGDDVVAMAEAAAGTRTAGLLVAESEALTWVGRCEPGDVLGISDGEVVLIAPDLAVGGLWLAHRMLTAGGELVTVLLGEGADEALGDGLAADLRRTHPEVDVVVHRGGQTGLPAGAGGGMTEIDVPGIDMLSPLPPLVGKRAADMLATQLEIHTVGDLVRHYPRRYVDRGKLTDIAGLEIGEHATLVAQVEKAVLRDMRARRGKLLAVVIRDEKGATLDCTFFNGHKVQHVIRPGVRAVFSGKVGVFNNKLQLTHPQFEPLDEADEVRPFLSVYPATAKVNSQEIARCVRQVLDLLDDPTDPLPALCRNREGLAELGRALRRIHVPEAEADIHAARNRLVWDEAMGVQLALALRRQATVSRPAPACPPKPGGLLDAFDAELPFTLTGGPARRRRRRSPPIWRASTR